MKIFTRITQRHSPFKCCCWLFTAASKLLRLMPFRPFRLKLDAAVAWLFRKMAFCWSKNCCCCCCCWMNCCCCCCCCNCCCCFLVGLELPFELLCVCCPLEGNISSGVALEEGAMGFAAMGFWALLGEFVWLLALVVLPFWWAWWWWLLLLLFAALGALRGLICILFLGGGVGDDSLAVEASLASDDEGDDLALVLDGVVFLAVLPDDGDVWCCERWWLESPLLLDAFVLFMLNGAVVAGGVAVSIVVGGVDAVVVAIAFLFRGVY